ncbi:hypothetical protein ACI3EY_16630 [Ornithinimicrobium sp. LYQ92]|uniref:hypothetical protein n=1 Tax=Serinicoccus sp. LYQ92 TaxID=3378798 RepID=UPI0038535DC6
MARLAANVVLRDPLGSPVVLVAGQDLPGWADGLVGAHALKDDVRSEPAEAQAPDGSWSIARLREVAAARGVDLGKAKKKTDILTALG